MGKHFVARAEEIPPGGRRLVKVAGRTIGVFNVEGAYYAIKNSCIHEGAPVCLGEIKGTYLPSEVGEYRWGMDGQVLRCPWHGWEFDLRTGGAIFDPDVKLKTYAVVEEEGALFVET